MAIKLTDNDIQQLIEEPKLLPDNWQDRTRLKQKAGHKEAQLDITGANGSSFRLIYRQADEDLLAFSVILAYSPPNSNECFHLRRYNGKNHQHSNGLEQPVQRFFDFHIHIATERYQDAGFNEDAYAEPTDRFTTLDDAFKCMAEDCAIAWPANQQMPLGI